jgi:protein-tyrosine phosphatase
VSDDTTREIEPLHVDYLPDELVNLGGRIGLTSAPGRRGRGGDGVEHERDLDQDLARLRHYFTTDVLVTLLERGQFVTDEFEQFDIADLLVRAQRSGMQTDWTALPGGNVPVALDTMFMLVERVLGHTHENRNVVIHCNDGLGRTGLVAACTLAALGADVEEAVETVRSIRPGAIVTASQMQTLRAFDELWRKRALSRADPVAISDLFDLADTGSGSGPWRISQPGMVPLSQAGAASVVYVGVEPTAAAAGVSDASPLRHGDVFHIMPGKVIWLGRGDECDITINSGQLSRVHALLAFVPVAEGRLLLADADSRNGTWIDDEQTTVSYLAIGTEFTLAKAYRFRFDALG